MASRRLRVRLNRPEAFFTRSGGSVPSATLLIGIIAVIRPTPRKICGQTSSQKSRSLMRTKRTGIIPARCQGGKSGCASIAASTAGSGTPCRLAIARQIRDHRSDRQCSCPWCGRRGLLHAYRTRHSIRPQPIRTRRLLCRRDGDKNGDADKPGQGPDCDTSQPHLSLLWNLPIRSSNPSRSRDVLAMGISGLRAGGEFRYAMWQAYCAPSLSVARGIWSFHSLGFIVLAYGVTALGLERCRSSSMLVICVPARALA
jgi:hypothetical protein